MSTLIIRVAAKYLIAVILLYSLFLLLRGHNNPGGGFVGGLAAAIAWSMFGIVYKESVTKRLFLTPSKISALGVFVMLLSGVMGLFGGGQFFSGIWVQIGGIALGTPLIFDIGVYLTVFGAVVNIVTYFEESL
ncbi:MAG: Na(+)/H(+) antiporter subunit B [Bacteriovoracaceae bacterium]|nr:Na(+)/H(+) antiporter subunit B [Bacteriovoracaceae bacterium]